MNTPFKCYLPQDMNKCHLESLAMQYVYKKLEFEKGSRIAIKGSKQITSLNQSQEIYPVLAILL